MSSNEHDDMRSGRYCADCAFWDAGPVQFLQCLLSAEVVVFGNVEYAKATEAYDLVSHNSRPVLIGREGSDDTRTVLLADELFKYTPEWTVGAGTQTPQRLLKLRDNLAVRTGSVRPTMPCAAALRQSVALSREPSHSAPYHTTAMSLEVLKPESGEREVVVLEVRRYDAPIGSEVRRMTYLRLLSLLDVASAWSWEYSELKNEMRRVCEYINNHLVRMGLSPDELLVSSTRGNVREKDSREYIPSGRPAGQSISVACACLCLARWSHERRSGPPGKRGLTSTALRQRCTSLMRSLCDRFLTPWPLQVVTAQLQLDIDIRGGQVQLQPLRLRSEGYELAMRIACTCAEGSYSVPCARLWGLYIVCSSCYLCPLS